MSFSFFRNRVSFLFFVLIYSMYIGTSFVSAQNNNQTVATSSQMKAETIATVNITNVKPIQNSFDNHVFTIFFDISNRIGIQPDVHYGVSLVKIDGNKQEIVDEKVYDEVLTLGEGVTLHKRIIYKAPENFSGTFSLMLVSRNSRAIPLSFAPLGTITLGESKNGFLSVDTTVCHLVMSDNKSGHNQSVQDLFSITKNDELTLSCTVKNSTKKSVDLNYSLVQHLGNAYGDLITKVSTSTGISIAPNSSKLVSVKIPKVTNPQSYYVAVSFNDKNTRIESNTSSFRYYLEGVGASIRMLLLDKDGYKKGDLATVSFTWSPVDSSFLDKKATTTEVRPLVSAVLSLVNDKKEVCATQISQVLTESDGIVKIPLSINAECINPEIHLSLVDKSQKVLDTQTFSITTGVMTVESKSFGVYGIITLLVGLVAAVLIFFFRKRVVSTVPIVALFMVISFFSGAKGAHADTVALTYICGAGYPVNPCPAATGIYITENLNKSSYVQGETIIVNYFVSSDDNPQPTNNINPVLKAVINGGSSMGSNAAIGPYTNAQMVSGFSVSANAGGVVPSGTSGTVSTSLGSNGYLSKTGGPLSFSIVPTCSWVIDQYSVSKCSTPFTYLPSSLPSCSTSNVNQQYIACSGVTQSVESCQCSGTLPPPPPPTVDVSFSP